MTCRQHDQHTVIER